MPPAAQTMGLHSRLTDIQPAGWSAVANPAADNRLTVDVFLDPTTDVGQTVITDITPRLLEIVGRGGLTSEIGVDLSVYPIVPAFMTVSGWLGKTLRRVVDRIQNHGSVTPMDVMLAVTQFESPESALTYLERFIDAEVLTANLPRNRLDRYADAIPNLDPPTGLQNPSWRTYLRVWTATKAWQAQLQGMMTADPNPYVFFDSEPVPATDMNGVSRSLFDHHRFQADRGTR